MCGIAGFVNWNGEPPSLGRIRAMTDRLRHRGPDGEGHHLHRNAALGHRRLSIIDVSTGAQPMGNEDGTVWVTFNGEIYNFREIRATLEAHGHVFRTASDTETIVHGFEQWGERVLDHLRGIFAFAVLDQRAGRLLLARDHFGVKPLVYYADDHRLVFASEAKAILAEPAVPRRIDAAAVADYFDYGYVPAPGFVLKGFTKLLPGHFVMADLDRRGSLEQRRYWKLEYGADEVEHEERALGALDDLLSESVRLQLVSDVPLGALLSGGIDSSTVVALMTRHTTGRVKTFSIGFEEERFSEAVYARQVAEHLGTDHHEYTVRADVAALLPRLVYHFDEPFSDASAVPTYYVCEMARRDVTVCLSGDGGDEMFAGYDRYRRCRDQGRLDVLPPALRRRLLKPLAALAPSFMPGRGFLSAAALEPHERFIEQIRGQYGRMGADDLLSERVRAALPAADRRGSYLQSALDPDVRDPLHAWLGVDVATYLPNDILTKVDVTSMMNSLEVRVPLLDHKLAEFVARLPPDFKLRGREGKYALRRLAAPLLPPGILDRPKMGFGVPMREWVASELRDLTHQYLLEPSRASGLLDIAVLRRIVEDNERRLYRSPTGGKLWWALFFEIWYQDVYGRPPADEAARAAAGAVPTGPQAV
jgi:asparagine synthase (glutamine-hydrolysing)